MAGNINIDSAAVIRAANKIRNAASSIDSASRTFQQIENSIEDSWRSVYTPQYIEILDNTYSEVRKTMNRLYDTASGLERIAAAVRRAEEEIKKQMASRR